MVRQDRPWRSEARLWCAAGHFIHIPLLRCNGMNQRVPSEQPQQQQSSSSGKQLKVRWNLCCNTQEVRTGIEQSKCARKSKRAHATKAREQIWNPRQKQSVHESLREHTQPRKRSGIHGVQRCTKVRESKRNQSKRSGIQGSQSARKSKRAHAIESNRQSA